MIPRIFERSPVRTSLSIPSTKGFGIERTHGIRPRVKGSGKEGSVFPFTLLGERVRFRVTPRIGVSHLWTSRTLFLPCSPLTSECSPSQNTSV